MNTLQPSSFKIPVKDFKRIETPLDYRGYRNYICVVDVLDLPDMKDWNSSNVRDAKSRGKVPNEIREGLLENDLFGFMNRGIVLLADSISFDNKNNNLLVYFKEPYMHGVGDGGHTRLIISEEKQALLKKKAQENDFLNRFIKLEILVGFDLSEIRDIVGARNTSNQVKDQSLLELERRFDTLKEFLKNESYFNDIAFKEYELYENSTISKPIDIREIISLMYMFDIESFSSHKHPVASYSTKASCLKHFDEKTKKENSFYDKIYPLLSEILLLRDNIYINLPNLYHEVAKKYREDVTRGNFGSLAGVNKYDDPNVELPFSKQKSNYRIPNAFIYPLLAAFRVFIEEKNGSYKWVRGCKPQELLKSEMGLNMVNALTDVVLDHKNPNKTGKYIPLWTNCYKEAELMLKDIKIASLEKKQKRID